MSNMNVTYADMTDAANKLRAGKEELLAKLQELGGYIDGLVGSGFQTDQASAAYNDRYDQFTTSMTQALDALDGLSSFLDQAAQTLGDTDAGLAGSISG